MHLLPAQEIGIAVDTPTAQQKTKGGVIFLMRLVLKSIFPFYQGGFKSSQGYVKVKLLKLKLQEDEEYLERQVKLEVRENFLHLQTNFAEIASL